MQEGHQLTFFTQQERLQDGQPLAHWLLTLAQQMGLRGATLSASLEGLGHDGRLHATNLFDFSDQPVQVTLVLSPEEEQRLLNHLVERGVRIFYTRCAVTFGITGAAKGEAGDNPPSN
jgi:uncharacterized protein